MRQVRTAIVLLVMLASLNARVFEAAGNASSNPLSGLNERIGGTGPEAAQKQNSKKRATQKPSSDQDLPGGVPGGVTGGPGGPAQLPPSIIRKSGGSFQKTAVKRVQPAYPPLAKAARVSGAVVVEVVVDEVGNVLSVRAISGHPLLKDAAEAAARQWEFTPAEQSGRPVKVIGTLTFTFTPGSEQQRDSPSVGELNEKEPSTQSADAAWQASLKSYRELIAKRPPDNKKLAMAMANLPSTAIDAERFAEALQLFKEAEQQNRLPAEAKPYYAGLIYYKFNYERSQPAQANVDNDRGGEILQRVRDLYVQAYDDESQKKPVDGRLLFDIGGNIYSLLGGPDMAEKKEAWLKKMLDIPGLAEKRRAEIYYMLGVGYWQRSYEISSPYTAKKLRVPDSAAERMKVEIQHGFEYIFKALSLDPDFDNAYYYSKLLFIEEGKIQRDPQRKKELAAKQQQAQERYQASVKRKFEAQTQPERPASEHAARTYASGLPVLRFAGLNPPPPPPPAPPPAPTSAPRRVTSQEPPPPPPDYAPRGEDSQGPPPVGVQGGVPGGQPGARSRRGPPTPPLIAAAKQLNLARVKALLAQKVNINAKDAEGKTALMHALSIAGGTATNVIDELLNRGANLNAKDNAGAAALSYAVISGYTSHIQTLIDKGAEVNASEGDGYTALMYAAENGKPEIVRILLDNGADVSITNGDGDTASSLAQEEGHTEIVEMLRKRSSGAGGDTPRTTGPKGLNEKDDSGETALTRAAKAERLQEVKALLDRGANANVKNGDNQAPLLIAIKNNNSEIAQALLDKGADSNSRSEYDGSALMIAIKNRNAKIVQALLAKGADPIAKSGFGDTPLEEAEESGNTEIILAVFGKLPDLNAKNRQGLTALMRAARAGRREVVQLLLSKGADPNAKGAMGASALALAFEKKRTEIARTLIAKGAVIDTIALINAIGSGLTEFVKLALDKGADVNASALMGVTPLMGAIMEGRTEIARMLIDKGAKVNATMAFGVMPLMGAAMEDNAEIVQMLLDKGADVNAKSIMNKTALMSSGAKTVRILLAKGADVNAKNDEGNTALMEAATKGRLEVVQALLDNGVDVNAKDQRGRTALVLAESEGQTRIVQVLLAKGADVTLKDNEGKTVLMIAAANGASDVVQALIDKRADVNAKDTAGKTPLMHATNKGQSEIVTLLKKAGAKE